MIWPWLLAVALIAGALVGGWFAYQALQDQLTAAKPVAVPDVKGLTEQLAVTNIRNAGLKELVQREPNADVKIGLVSEQDPQPGDRTEKGNFVTIVVSTGPPKTRVPDVVGQSRDQAVSDLVSAGLKANVVSINSLQPVNTVLATAPKAGHRAGRRVDRPRQRLEGTEAGHGAERDRFGVRERAVLASGRRLRGRPRGGRGSAAAGTVVGQNPAAGTQQSKGSVITLQVSSGPQTSQIPDVTSQTEADAARSCSSPASRFRWSRRSSTTRASTDACSRRTRRAAPTRSRARRW